MLKGFSDFPLHPFRPWSNFNTDNRITKLDCRLVLKRGTIKPEPGNFEVVGVAIRLWHLREHVNRQALVYHIRKNLSCLCGRVKKILIGMER